MKFKAIRHFHKVNKHRFLVFRYCLRCGMPWRGLVHDLSKYSPTEFFESVKYYNGTHSPINDCRQDRGYSLAWLHHKGRNKHHLEYWYDFQNKEPIIIPYKYAVEYICDSISASKAYKGKDFTVTAPLEYQTKILEYLIVHPKIKAFILQCVKDLAEHGEKYIFNRKYMKRTYQTVVFESKLEENK